MTATAHTEVIFHLSSSKRSFTSFFALFYASLTERVHRSAAINIFIVYCEKRTQARLSLILSQDLPEFCILKEARIVKLIPQSRLN